MAIGHFQLLMTFLSKTRETTLSHLFDHLLSERPKISTLLLQVTNCYLLEQEVLREPDLIQCKVTIIHDLHMCL